MTVNLLYAALVPARHALLVAVIIRLVILMAAVKAIVRRIFYHIVAFFAQTAIPSGNCKGIAAGAFLSRHFFEC